MTTSTAQRMLAPGATLPDFELPDHTGTMRRLSDLQGEDPMVLLLSRGEHCPRERQHHLDLLQFHRWCAVAFTSLVTILPNDVHVTDRMRKSLGAGWAFLSDGDLEVQRTLGIEEYTDPNHDSTIPYTLLLAPGLVIDRVYHGYWFWGRPSAYRLWEDLGDLLRRIKHDFDPTTPEARDVWEASR